MRGVLYITFLSDSNRPLLRTLPFIICLCSIRLLPTASDTYRTSIAAFLISVLGAQFLPGFSLCGLVTLMLLLSLSDSCTSQILPYVRLRSGSTESR